MWFHFYDLKRIINKKKPTMKSLFIVSKHVLHQYWKPLQIFWRHGVIQNKDIRCILERSSETTIAESNALRDQFQDLSNSYLTILDNIPKKSYFYTNTKSWVIQLSCTGLYNLFKNHVLLSVVVICFRETSCQKSE